MTDATWWSSTGHGLASALDSFEVGGGRDVGQTGVFEAAAPDGHR